ncbi:biopolymer transporter ExbD, partial [Escherichia sp. TWPC-MK]
MAMHLNENLDDNGEMHDINVTPFIDVMLVLLIIFMVAAPLSTVLSARKKMVVSFLPSVNAFN